MGDKTAETIRVIITCTNGAVYQRDYLGASRTVAEAISDLVGFCVSAPVDIHAFFVEGV